MAIYQLDLESLEVAKDEYMKSAEQIGIDIETSNTAVTQTTTDIFEGEDGDTFRTEFGNYINVDFTDTGKIIKNIGTALESSLEEGRKCKKICDDFLYTLEGSVSGTIAENMNGMLYCDQYAITELKAMCTTALIHAEKVRVGSLELESILEKLQMVKLDAGQYTETIREGCKKVDRLEEYSTELTTYATAIENADVGLKGQLDTCLPIGYWKRNYNIDNSLSAEAQYVINLINNSEGEWTEADKQICEENLQILKETGEIDELEKIVEAIAISENDTWTECQVMVMGKIYTYAMQNNELKLIETVLNSVIEVENVDGKMRNYVNQNKSDAILAEIDWKEDGESYFTLARVSHYYDEQNGGGNVEDVYINVGEYNGEMVIEISLKDHEVAVSSINMNEVVGTDGIENLAELGFSEGEIKALMSSIYTDEDILFIGDLANAKSEEDYYRLFQHEPEKLGVATIDTLYQYSYTLITNDRIFDVWWCEKDEGEELSLDQFESFINGLLKTESIAAGNTEQYLTYLAAQGSLQLDAIKNVMPWYIDYIDDESCLSSTDKNRGLQSLVIDYEWNAKLYGLYASLLARREDAEQAGLKGIGNHTQISGLCFRISEYTDEGDKIVDLLKTNFDYYETTLYWNNECADFVGLENEDELIEHPISIEIYSGDESLREKKSMELITAEKEKKMALSKSAIKAGIGIASIYQPWVGIAVGVIESAATLNASVAADTTKASVDTLNDQYLDGNIYAKATIEGLDGLTDLLIEGHNANKKVAALERDINTSLFGGVITLDGYTIAAEGIYTTNDLLKRAELETNGLSFLVEPEMKEVITETLLRSNNKENLEIINNAQRQKGRSLSIEEEQIIPALYLLWTGDVYAYEDGSMSDMNCIDSLSASDIKECMNMLDEIAYDKQDEKHPYNKGTVSASGYINYNILENKYEGVLKNE